ncbi:MAG: YaiI/YqxD family protein [Gemmobacter sp.]|nr:YaiI/YqxD family protein [Gemmobacter sp.]
MGQVENSGWRIYVDADACPVKAEVERVAARHDVRVAMVSNGGIRPSADPRVQMIYVPDGPDEADKWIADRAGPGDVVVTGDIPLAAKCVAAGARVIKHNGEPLTQANIGNVLATRDLMADLRAADPFRQGGGKTFGREDRSRFLDALDRALRMGAA